VCVCVCVCDRWRDACTKPNGVCVHMFAVYAKRCVCVYSPYMVNGVCVCSPCMLMRIYVRIYTGDGHLHGPNNTLA
jgi:hypothetical protein